MDSIQDENLVTDYEKHIPTLKLPDLNDRHVLAAAIQAQASFIVTFNLSDFPLLSLKPHHIQAVHPDAFLCKLLDKAPATFLEAVNTHRASLTKPPKDQPVKSYRHVASPTKPECALGNTSAPRDFTWPVVCIE